MCKRILLWSLLLLGTVSLAVMPAKAGAQSAGAEQETVTMQVDVTSPNGVKITGTLVIRRQGVAPSQDTLSFVGTMNGSPATMSAVGTENWEGTDRAKLTVDRVTKWETSIEPPHLPMSFDLVQVSDNLLTLDGIPFAISGRLSKPGMGSAAYIVTSAGTGSYNIEFLPRTGAGTEPVLTTPVAITLALVACGLAMVMGSLWLRRRYRRAMSEAEEIEAPGAEATSTVRSETFTA